MTHDPPERDTLGRVDWGRLSDVGPTSHHVIISPVGNYPGGVAPDPHPPPERDPSNLNDPKLQRLVIAAAYLFVLAALGTCVAGGMCLAGAFCDEKECAAGAGGS